MILQEFLAMIDICVKTVPILQILRDAWGRLLHPQPVEYLQDLGG